MLGIPALIRRFAPPSPGGRRTRSQLSPSNLRINELDTPPRGLISDRDSCFTLREHYDGTANEMASPGSSRDRFFYLDDVGGSATGQKDRRHGAEERRKRHGMVEQGDELGRAALQRDDSDQSRE